MKSATPAKPNCVNSSPNELLQRQAGGELDPVRLRAPGVARVISTTLCHEAIHAADHLPDSGLGPCSAAAAHRWDLPADRAAAR